MTIKVKAKGVDFPILELVDYMDREGIHFVFDIEIKEENLSPMQLAKFTYGLGASLNKVDVENNTIYID